MWWVLWLRLRSNPNPLTATTGEAPSWLAHTLFGIALGFGAGYKSFALVAPASAAVWCAVLWSAPKITGRLALRTTAGVTWSALIGVGIFALWFVLDPDPAAVWQEFVLGENAGKMRSTVGYWHAALHGPYPMWQQLLAYPVNAGLLFFTALGLCWLGLRQGVRATTYARLTPAQRVLVVWLLVWLIVFTIPTQRSERYVIPAVPALAIGMALLWQRIGRVWSLATLLLMAPALVMLARIAGVIGQMELGSPLVTGGALGVAIAGLLAVFLGLFNARWTRNASLVACAAVYACFNLMVDPLSHPDIDYPAPVHTQMQGQRIAVPNNFTGRFESYHFVLRGARITPYDAEDRNTGELYPDMPSDARLLRLLNEFDAVIWLQDDVTQEEPPCLPQCRLVAQRWHVKNRHKSGDITLDNLWYPQEWLFGREWLLVKAGR